MQACGGSKHQYPLHCMQIAIELGLGLEGSWLSPERLEELRGLFGDWLQGFTSTFAVDVSWTGGYVAFVSFAAALWAQHGYRACMHLSHHACTSPVPGLHRGAATALEGVHAATILLRSCSKGTLCSSGEAQGANDLFSLPCRHEQHQ